MKIDPRIKKDKRPLSCFDTDAAKEFIGKACYFGINIEDFEPFGNSEQL